MLTITGSFLPGDRLLGAKTLRYRQSSSPPNDTVFPEPGIRQPGPGVEASLTTLQRGMGCGARKRRLPIGGFAKGTPSQASMPPDVTPESGPLGGVTTEAWATPGAAISRPSTTARRATMRTLPSTYGSS